MVCMAPTVYRTKPSGAQLLTVDTSVVLSATIPTSFRAAAFYDGANETEAGYAYSIFSSFADIGLVRAQDFPYPQNSDCSSPSTNDYECATTTADALTALNAYLSEDRIANAVATGTVILYAGPWNGGYSAGTAPATFLYAEPDDTTVSGAFETHVACLMELAGTSNLDVCGSGLTGFGYGFAQAIGDPGVMFEGPNEANNLWAETQATYSATLQAEYRACQSVSTDCHIVGPSINNIATNPTYLTDTVDDFQTAGFTQIVGDIHSLNYCNARLNGIRHGVDEIKAAWDAALSAAGMSASTELISGEFQNCSATAYGDRYGHESAAYFIGTLIARDRAGWSGALMAALTKEDVPAPADGDAYEENGSFGGWGHCPKPTATSSYQAGCSPSFMAMGDFQGFASGTQVLVQPNELNERGIDAYGFLTSDSVWLVMSRWDLPDHPSSSDITITLEGACPSGLSLSQSLIAQFDEQVNDPAYVYYNHGGTDSENADASRTESENLSVSTGSSLTETVTMGPAGAAIVRWSCL